MINLIILRYKSWSGDLLTLKYEEYKSDTHNISKHSFTFMSHSERLVNLKCNIVVAPVLPWVFEIVVLKVYDVIFLLLAPFMFFF